MDSLIADAANILASKHAIEVSDLDYIGSADMSWKEEGACQIMFNVIKPGHKHHKSSVAVNSWNM
jgi:hypothetical protein